MSLIIILFIVMLVIFSILWGNRTFSVKTLNQMIYHMIVPCDGTDEGIFKDWFLNCAPPTFLTTLIGVFLFGLILGAVCAALTQKIRKSSNPILYLFYAQLALYLALSFFSSWFTVPTTWFWFALTGALYLYVKK